jgi:hypothetical protein
MGAMERLLSECLQHMKQQEQRITRLEGSLGAKPQIPGYKHPFIGVVPIKFLAGDLSPKQAVFNITKSGPFMLTTLAAFTLLENSETPGIFNWRPISSLPDTVEPPTVSAMDFLWTLEQAGSTVHFQNRPIGSPYLFSNVDRPLYNPVEYLFEGNDALSIELTPTVTPPIDVTIYFCILGYKVYAVNALGNLGQDQPSIEELPGKRRPYRLVLEANVTKGQTEEITMSETVSASGLFVVTDLAATWRSNASADDFGRFRHISSMQDLQTLPSENAIDFRWGVVASGSDLKWQGPGTNPVPSPLLFTNQERPLYLPAPAQLSPNTIVDFTATPLAVPEGGVLQFILNGYQVIQGETWKGA